MRDTICPLSFVRLAILPYHFTSTMSLTIFELSFIYITILKCDFALTMRLAISLSAEVDIPSRILLFKILSCKSDQLHSQRVDLFYCNAMILTHHSIGNVFHYSFDLLFHHVLDIAVYIFCNTISLFFHSRLHITSLLYSLSDVF